MLSRLVVAAALGLLGTVARADAANAAENPDREEVAIATFLVAIGLIAVLGIAYLLRRALGLDKMPPAEPEGGDHH